MELDHMTPRAEGGPDTIENAIALCFECHAEIHSYNDAHPRGRKFHPEELLQHKKQWLELCKVEPALFQVGPFMASVGPLQSLIDELEFNIVVAGHNQQDQQGCLFLDEQFKKAIQDGAIAVLKTELKKAIIEAYRAVGQANQHIMAIMRHPVHSDPWAEAVNRASNSTAAARPLILKAHDALLGFLQDET